MVDGDGQSSVAIHLRHLPEKIWPMIWASLEDVVLPLMNHFMGDGADQLVPAVGGRDRRISRGGDRLATTSRQEDLGPARLTNIPTDEVSRRLQTISIKGSTP